MAGAKELPGTLPQTASQDLSALKQNFMSAEVAFAADMLSLARRADELAAFYSANLQGANAIGFPDIPTSLGWLTPTLVTSLITQAQTLTTATPQGVRDVLRQVSGNPRTVG